MEFLFFFSQRRSLWRLVENLKIWITGHFMTQFTCAFVAIGSDLWKSDPLDRNSHHEYKLARQDFYTQHRRVTITHTPLDSDSDSVFIAVILKSPQHIQNSVARTVVKAHTSPLFSNHFTGLKLMNELNIKCPPLMKFSPPSLHIP